MLRDLLNTLETHYGTPGLLPAGGPLDMILWESVTKLVNEERRKNRSQSLKPKIDNRSETRHKQRRLAKITQLVMELFGGDINRVLDLPVEDAKKALQLFPEISEPAAEKILLLNRRLPVLAVDVDGLRALLRLGFGKTQSTYSATYLCVQESLRPHIISDFDWLIRAHHLLRIHGQEICKRRVPRCRNCPVRSMCAYFRERTS